jgi:hypothetical protein
MFSDLTSQATTARAEVDKRYSEQEAAVAADDDGSDAEDGNLDKEEARAEMTAVGEEEERAIEAALALLQADDGDVGSAIDGLAGFSANGIVQQSQKHWQRAQQNAQAFSSTRARRASRAVTSKSHRDLADVFKPLKDASPSVYYNEGGASGATDTRAEFVLYSSDAKDMMLCMRARQRSARLTTQTATARNDRLRMSDMSDIERLRAMQAQQRAKLEAEQVGKRSLGHRCIHDFKPTLPRMHTPTGTMDMSAGAERAT